MSRIGNKPIKIPVNVKIIYQNGIIEVNGQNGRLAQIIDKDVYIERKGDFLHVIASENSARIRALQGLFRSLLANMIIGATEGFERVLEVNGIGYKAEVRENIIAFNLGYSHTINFKLPKSIKATIDKNVIKLFGSDKQKLGLVAALIRNLRLPEPYKGKGIKYFEENITKKAGKTGTK